MATLKEKFVQKMVPFGEKVKKITKESGWSLYHIRPRVYGGTDSMSNLLMLHPYCRERVRYQKLNVTKPGADKVP